MVVITNNQPKFTNYKANNQIKVNFKAIIILFLFLIGLYLLLPKLVDAQAALKLILKVNKFYLFLAVLSEFLSYVGAAWLLGIILSKLGYKIRFWDRFKLGSIAAFAIHFFPVGTFGQGAVDYYFLKKKKVETGSILIMLILRIIITYMAFFGLFFLALIMLPTLPNLRLCFKIAVVVILLLVVWGAFYLYYLYHHKETFRRVWQKILRFANFFLKRFRNSPINLERSNEIFEDIYKGLKLFSRKKRFSLLAILAGMIYWLGDVTCFFFVFLSFGYLINGGILMFSYGIGVIAGMASFIPGGLGVTEGSLGLVLTGLGIPSTVALMSILVFRLFSFWIWIPVGLYSYLTLRKQR